MILVKLWLAILLIFICIADIRRLIIPDICILLMLPAALFSAQSWRIRLIAAASVWLLFTLLAILSALFKQSVPIGMGDIKLLSSIGLISGPEALVSTALISSLLGGTFAAILLLLKKVQKKDQIAFGPFIAIGFAVYLASVSAM